MAPRVLRLGLLAQLLVAASAAEAQWPRGLRVLDTPHNLTRPAKSQDPDMAGRIRDYSDVCSYCHTPHGGITMRPLWNRRRPTTAYRMYTSGTINMIIDPSPNDASRACLSCHDGTIGLDDVLNRPNIAGAVNPANSVIKDCEGCHSGGSPDGGIDWEGVWIEPDLRKMHPVSVVYDETRDAGFWPAVTVTAAGLPLIGGRVECLTCHDPHTQRYAPFLRLPNAGNALCLTCHRTNPGGTAHAW